MNLHKMIAFIATAIFTFSCGYNSSDKAALETQSIENLRKLEIDPVADKENEIGDKKNGYVGEPDQKQKPPQTDKKQQQPSTEQPPKPDWDKKIIKTASVNLEVKDYNKYYALLREKVRNMGGYIAQEEQKESDFKIENSMTIKVPVDQFDNAIIQLTNDVQKINERKISSQDVTSEVVDTKSRMEAKKHVRQRYMDLLGQAKNMQDILNVQSEINGIQEEIESAAGRIEYLSHSSVFSTINLTYYQILNASAQAPEGKATSFGAKLKESFRTGWEIISNFFLVIVTIWPLLLGSFFAYLLYKKLKAPKVKQA